jgi:hypothetical protein
VFAVRASLAMALNSGGGRIGAGAATAVPVATQPRVGRMDIRSGQHTYMITITPQEHIVNEQTNQSINRLRHECVLIDMTEMHAITPLPRHLKSIYLYI